jgi:peptidoglycan/LPS O-acetylase OafA/YrhL
MIAAVGAGSIAYSIFLTPLDPETAYFATMTRAWELALGGILAVCFTKDAFSHSFRALLRLLGILGIIVASLAYNESTRFPGYAALLPTAAAAAVIASNGSQAPWSARIVLNSRLFQYLGDISYSLYLWHWPLIVVYGETTGQTIGLADGTLILLVSCGLAHVSKVFVEDRFRSASFAIGRTIAVGAGCLAATLLLGVGYLAWSDQDRGPVALNGRPGAMAMVDPQYKWQEEDIANVIPKPENVKADVPSIYTTSVTKISARARF